MAGRFHDRVVFVTGGTSGLGAQTCELFLAEGAKVFVTDIEERDASIRFGANAFFYPCNVTEPSSCFAAVEACMTKYGKIDVLFHNGARLSPITTVVDHDIAAFQSVINTNLCGAFFLAKAIIPFMQKQGKGVIINTASISGLGGDYGLASYNAAKAGLVNFTRTIAIDHAREGIRAVTVCPGYMQTRMTESIKTSANSKELQDVLFESIPMGRGADLKEVARTVLFLASDDASYITGHPFIVDGGWTARNPSPKWSDYLG